MKSAMTGFRSFARRFACDESAATAMEYAIIATLIATAIIAIVMTLGSDLAGLYTKVETAVSSASS